MWCDSHSYHRGSCINHYGCLAVTKEKEIRYEKLMVWKYPIEQRRDITRGQNRRTYRLIINKFADEKLSYAEALIVLESAKDVVGDFCSVQRVDWRDERNG